MIMQRQNELNNWLAQVFPKQNFELSFAAADADFRRYFRASFADGGTVICMDAPPNKMSIMPYINVQNLFTMIRVPQIFAFDEALGFMAIEDFGSTTLLTALQHDKCLEVHKALLLEAIDTLITLQVASRSDVLPIYDKELMQRELNLFPAWFAAEELGKPLNFAQKKLWQAGLDALLPVIGAQEKVFVHRDFIVRNLMLTADKLGVLDFQDAVYGPLTYDLVSLLRDAFIEWDEKFVLDLMVRYWEKARVANLPVRANIDEFYRDFEYMGVQRHLKVVGIFARLFHRDGKDKYRPEIPRFLDYLKKTTRRYHDLAPIYQLIVELVGDEVQTGYTF